MAEISTSLATVPARPDKPRRRPQKQSVADALITPCAPKPKYSIEGNLRRVEPYFFTYDTWCKQRWRGRELLEIFSDEFRDRPIEYYKGAIEGGQIRLNGKIVTSTTAPVKNGDLLSHTMHRHEPPVTSRSIGIVHEDDDMIVIDKPAGVPVHPTGRYNFNSVTQIMTAERGFGFVPHPCNRLDRLTSGVMFLAKHAKAAVEMTSQITARTVKKEYVARVKGRFPDGQVVCEQPILQISPKLGLNRVRARGKEARTVFERLAYHHPPPSTGSHVSTTTIESDSTDVSATPVTGSDRTTKDEGYSIVRCRPLTGRTHQLRVHLQFLGHPITNDPIYSNTNVFGPALAAGDSSSDNDETIISALSRMGKAEAAQTLSDQYDTMATEYAVRKAEKLSGQSCPVCGTELYTDPGPHELGIYLHARKYADQDGKWSYETELPDWALPPRGVEGPVKLDDESNPLAADVDRLQLKEEEEEA